MGYRTVIATITSLLVVTTSFGAGNAAAVSPGLSVSPVRKELSTSAGVVSEGNFEVSNRTDKSIKVNLFVRQFAVTDYKYDYKFSQPKYDWIRLDESAVTLLPNQIKKIRYKVIVPASAASGGYYYALFASTDRQQDDESMSFRLQAASLLNLTVDGGSAKKSAVINNDQVPLVSTGNMIQYRFDVKNTGNVHFFGEYFARLQGVLARAADKGEERVVYPGTSRTVQGSVQAPLLPGVYQLTYGYVIDGPAKTVQHTAYVVFIPPWSIVALLMLLIAAKGLWRRSRRSPRPSSDQ